MPPPQMYQKYYVEDLSIAISMTGLANSARTYSEIIYIGYYGWEQIHLQVRFKTGNSGVNVNTGKVKFLLRGSTNGTEFDAETTGAWEMEYTANQSNTDYTFSLYPITTSPWPVYWQLVVINKTGAAFSADPTHFSASYTGSKWVLVTDRFDHFYRPSGKLFNVLGDFFEISFPVVATMTGGLAIKGQMPMDFRPAGMLRLSGVASVQTPNPNFAVGQVAFMGSAGGPSPTP